MKILKRIGFYLIGVSLGCVVVIFIWKGKDVSFDYGMDARTLSSIRKKQLIYTPEVQQSMNQLNIDSIIIQKILNTGNVDFGKSKARQKPCAEYYIIGKDSLKNVHLYIERCDSVATIQKVWNVKN